MSFPTSFSALNSRYKAAWFMAFGAEPPELDQKYTRVLFPRSNPTLKHWNLMTDETTSVGMFSQASNGGYGGFVWL